MKYSSVTERIGGDSVDAWDVHYRGMARLEAGEDIILLSVGQESDETTPQAIVNSAVDSLQRGRHHYSEVAGIEPLRNAIARRHRQLTGQVVDAGNCIVLAGAQNALFAVCQCILDHGDEVILSEPYYTTYPATVTASGARLVSVPVRPEDGFRIDPARIAAAVTPRTRAIVLNSPNNPTGAVYTREQFEAVVDICLANDIWLVSDEVYQEILPDTDRFSPASLERAAPICITLSSLSKSHRMTGWRMGWAVGPKELIGHLYNLSMCMSYGLAPFVQDAALTALEVDHATAGEVRDAMLRRRQVLTDALVDVPGIRLFSSEGGMFVVLDIRDLQVSGMSFAQGLLDQHRVAVLPCDGFGPSGAGLLRISLCASRDKLVVAAERIVEYVETMRSGVAQN
jgi:arginine:pyruvate transaminase